jgi:hypothetical protein
VKPLACMIGRHSWTTRVDQSTSDEVCSRCGAERLSVGSDALTGNDDVARRVQVRDKLSIHHGTDNLGDGH